MPTDAWQQKREDIRKDQPVGRLGLSSGRINKRYLVLYRPLRQGISRRRAVGEEKSDRSTVLSILDAFVDLDGAIGTPLGLELLDLELHAVDAAFDFVDVAEIVDLARPPKCSGGRVGANPVRRQRNVLLVIAGISRRCDEIGRSEARGEQPCQDQAFHKLLLHA